MSSPGEYGAYRTLRVLGEGARGVVYLAERTEPLRRQVALKVLRPGVDARVVIARFEAERRTLAALDEPDIARVLDVGLSRSGVPYFAMEYVPGTPITRYCDEHRLSVAERLEIFGSVCRTVAHAHEKGLLHEGLKPPKVLVIHHDGAPRAKVLDFGIAGALERRLARQTLHETERRPGSLAYISPEQTEMTGLDVDARADVYALGVMLYELLVGVLPFREEELTGPSALYAVLETAPPTLAARFDELGERRPTVAEQRSTDVADLTKHLNGDLHLIVRNAMAKDRSRRYRTAADLALDLQNYLTGHPVSAHPPGVGYRVGKFVRRNRRAVLAVVAGLLMVGVIVVVYVLT